MRVSCFTVPPVAGWNKELSKTVERVCQNMKKKVEKKRSESLLRTKAKSWEGGEKTCERKPC